MPHDVTVEMEMLDSGYFAATVPDPGGNVNYFYMLEGCVERPDPASHYQPMGVHGPSMLVRHDDFAWQDDGWQTPPLEDLITYELHVGTFTAEGTFDAAIGRLPYLKELGVTAIEIMPVAQFPGARNWGYDGALPYAVQNTYGGPDGLKRLVNACHKNGIAVVLDVVYNHLGPEGNYTGEFGPYRTNRYRGPWGDAMNFDGPHSHGVRRFFIENAVYWFEKYHMDALRIDAVHGIFDRSDKHFLRELQETVRGRITGRPAYLIAESDLNDVRLITPPEAGGYGLDAQWNDDYHHCLHTLLTGESDGYYMDFGSLGQLTKALKEGFVYTGQYSKFRGRGHGTSCAERPASQLVVFSQNHDQVGNRMMGDRLAESLSVEKLKLAASMVMLTPYLPLMFMGEEYGETAPFRYFISHADPALVEAVRKARREDFSKFAWEGEAPDPQALETYMACKINPGLRRSGKHKELFEFYRTLISLRKRHPALGKAGKEQMEVLEYPDERVVTLRRWYGDEQFYMAASFSDTASAIRPELPAGKWRKVLESQPNEHNLDFSVKSGKIELKIHLVPYGFILYEMHAKAV